jgi:hypothetical protein
MTAPNVPPPMMMTSNPRDRPATVDGRAIDRLLQRIAKKATHVVECEGGGFSLQTHIESSFMDSGKSGKLTPREEPSARNPDA